MSDLFTQNAHGHWQVNTPPAVQARDHALAVVSDHAADWMDLAFAFFVKSPPTLREFTGEEVRLYVTSHVGAPHHHNAWGALINRLVRSKVISSTGEWRAMKAARSHARKTQVYMMNGKGNANV